VWPELLILFFRCVRVLNISASGAETGFQVRRKIMIFHTKYPKYFRASLHNWKNMIFLAQDRDFSHEIPQTFSRLPPLGAIFLRHGDQF
jgi:hypothetical protein